MRKFLLFLLLLAASSSMFAQDDQDSYVMNLNLKNGEHLTFTLANHSASKVLLSVSAEFANNQIQIGESSLEPSLGTYTYKLSEPYPIDDVESITFNWAGEQEPVLARQFATIFADPKNGTTTTYRIEDIEKINIGESVDDGEGKTQHNLWIWTKNGDKRDFAIDGIFASIRCSTIEDILTQPYTTMTRHAKGYTVTWPAKNIGYYDGNYIVELQCPLDYNLGLGLCFGAKPNLNIEECDTIWNHSNVYIGRGPYGSSIKTNLEYGQTYYYRFCARFPVEGHENALYYGPEYSFRVPKVIGDSNYSLSTDPAPSNEAIAAAFHDKIVRPTSSELTDLWDEWRKTPDGQQEDLSSDIVSEQFDDAIGYKLNRMPSKFYNWLCNREMVIDAFDYFFDIEYPIPVDTIKVTDIASSWAVPDNKYMKFGSIDYKTNYSVNYRIKGMMPDIPYKLKVTFAPETELENNEENAKNFLPTKVRILRNNKEKNVLFSDIEIPSTEVTTLVYDSIMTDASSKSNSFIFDLAIQTRVKAIELRHLMYNRILRIAEISLTPMTDSQISGIKELPDGMERKRWATDSWFSLDGRRLFGEPEKNGIYIHNGKIIVK